MITTRTRAKKKKSAYYDMRNLSSYVVNLMTAQMVLPQLVHICE